MENLTHLAYTGKSVTGARSPEGTTECHFPITWGLTPITEPHMNPPCLLHCDQCPVPLETFPLLFHGDEYRLSQASSAERGSEGIKMKEESQYDRDRGRICESSWHGVAPSTWKSYNRRSPFFRHMCVCALHGGTLALDNVTWTDRTVAYTACECESSFARSKDTNERTDGTEREQYQSIDGCASQQSSIDHCPHSNRVSSRSTLTEDMPKKPFPIEFIAKIAEDDKDTAIGTCDMLNAAVPPLPNTSAGQKGRVIMGAEPVVWTVTGGLEETAKYTLRWSAKTEAYREMLPKLEARQTASPALQQHFLRQLSRADRFSLLMNLTVFPPLVWALLQILDLESPNVLEQRLQQLLPIMSWGISALQDHQTISLYLILCLSGLESIALVKPLASMGKRQRLFSDSCCLLSLAVVLPLWARVGGSIITLFLVFVPYTFGVGMSLGLLFDHLWTRRRVKQISSICRTSFTPAGIDGDVRKKLRPATESDVDDTIFLV